MSIRYLEHATDAFIEVKGNSLEQAFLKAGESVIDTTLDMSSVQEKEKKALKVTGRDLRYLLYNWCEEVIYMLITEGFAIARLELAISKNDEYTIEATAYGEPIDLGKHHFKIEVKAPTFHLMEITQGDTVVMRFLLDL